jgi:hypothetical protein
VHNSTTAVPHELPASKDSSRWRSNSYPGGAGYNEIHFKDTNGAEEFNLQAQKDHSRVVNNDMRSHVGNDKASHVGNNDSHHVGADSLLNAGGSILTNALSMHRMLVGDSTGMVMRQDKVIVLSTGGASIKLSGDNVDINAKGNICFHAGKEMHISSHKGSIRIQGGKHVVINEQERGPEVKPDKPRVADSPLPPASGNAGTPPFKPSGFPAAIAAAGSFAEAFLGTGGGANGKSES